jgi:hypothetical protein
VPSVYPDDDDRDVRRPADFRDLDIIAEVASGLRAEDPRPRRDPACPAQPGRRRPPGARDCRLTGETTVRSGKRLFILNVPLLHVAAPLHPGTVESRPRTCGPTRSTSPTGGSASNRCSGRGTRSRSWICRTSRSCPTSSSAASLPTGRRHREGRLRRRVLTPLPAGVAARCGHAARAPVFRSGPNMGSEAVRAHAATGRGTLLVDLGPAEFLVPGVVDGLGQELLCTAGKSGR